ncbi:MAG: hypothetical protein RL318_371 [Fibrobacterota bacterium]|jgi:hypothetical protein
MIRKALAIASIIASSAIYAENSQKEKISAIGIYLDSPDYDQSAFALLEQAEEVMESAFPSVPWEAIDSSSPKTKSLPAPLPVLGSLTLPTPDGQAKVLAKAIGTSFGKSHLLLIRRGGTRAQRDSSASFSDRSSFTLLECQTGKVIFRQDSQATGQRGKTSAETAWARGVWADFLKGWKSSAQSK